MANPGGWREEDHEEDGPRLSPLILGMSLISLLLLAWTMRQRGGAPPLPLLGLGLAAELLAPRLGPFGYFSCSGGLWLAAAALAPAPAAFAALAALALRSLIRPAANALQRFLELCADLFPHALGLALLLFLSRSGPLEPRFAPALVGYGLLWLFTPGLFSSALDRETFTRWSRSREALWTALAGQLAGGYLVFRAPHLWPLLIPLLAALLDSARRVDYQLQAVYESGRRSQADAQLSLQRRQLVETRSSQEVNEARLEVQMESYQLIDKLLSSLRHSPSLKTIALAVLEQVRTRIPCTSAALYLESGGALTIVAAITAHQDRVQSAPILGLSESLVERAWQRGKLQHIEPHDLHNLQRVFPDEAHALAAPILDRGVIYVGHQQPLQLSERELQALDSLARHSWLALQAARSQEEQQAAYQREQAARRVSEELLNRLADLVAGMNRLLPLNQPEQLVQAGAHMVQELLRARSPQVYIRFESIEQNELQGPLDGVQELIQSSLKSRLPILHNELTRSPFYREGSPYACLLVVPLIVQQQQAGFILAAARQPFERDDQDILSLLALQLGPILQTVRLYADLQRTHQKLRESQAQLVQSSKMAAIGQLAGGVAHEINTPLGAVTISLDAVVNSLTTRPEKAMERLQKARKACLRMKEIVAKLLFYSRDTATHRSSTDLNQVIRDTLDFIGSQIRLDNIEIDTQLQALPSTLVNQNEIQQILINLLNNARDAVLMEGADERRGIFIRSAAQAGECLIQVRDSGPGVPAQQAEKIFDPFFTSKPVGQGTGLGLSVSRELAEQNGGSLTLLPQTSAGAVFELRLPLAGKLEESEGSVR